MKILRASTLLLVVLAIAASLAALGQDDSEVVAVVNGTPITRHTLNNAAANDLRQVRQQEYEVLSAALDRLVSEQILNAEAAQRGITIEEFLQTEIDGKLVSISDEEVDKFYEANKASLRGKSRQESDESLRAYLLQQRRYQQSKLVLDALRAKAGVSILLEPPRVAVTIPPDAPSLGPENAVVTVVEFSDFQCPYCRRAHPAVEQLLEAYGEKIRFVYRDYPLPNHPRAVPAAVAARCAGEQGKYWEYHDNLMKVDGTLDDIDLNKRAVQVALDREAFRSCVDSGRYEDAVRASMNDGGAIGVTGTPAFFINGRMLSGAQPFSVLKRVVDEELERAGQAN
jgi:protein-disulfide isomerase